jgi:hypothetical protein
VLTPALNWYYINPVQRKQGIAEMLRFFRSIFAAPVKQTVAEIADRRIVLATMSRDERLTRNNFVARCDRTNS